MNATSLADAVAGMVSTASLGRVQINCDRHGPYMALGCSYLKMRREVWSGCPRCARAAAWASMRAHLQAEQQEREQRRLARLAETIEHASIPERFKTRSLENFEARTEQQQAVLEVARRYVANWERIARAGQWLVFAGQPGVGKSHIAIAILRALMPAYVGQYVTCMGMIQAVRATWARGSETTEAEVLRHFGTTPLLVVDEVGVQYGTPGEHTIIFDVLDRRYRDMRPTILLTNHDTEEFVSYIGERLWDRMSENTRWIRFDGDSYRSDARTASYGEKASHGG